jgi:hypothetical protein
LVFYKPPLGGWGVKYINAPVIQFKRDIKSPPLGDLGVKNQKGIIRSAHDPIEGVLQNQYRYVDQGLFAPLMIPGGEPCKTNTDMLIRDYSLRS